jgi:hypothetical protein
VGAGGRVHGASFLVEALEALQPRLYLLVIDDEPGCHAEGQDCAEHEAIEGIEHCSCLTAARR